MRGGSQIRRIARKGGSLLSAFLVILTLALSLPTAADAHDGPRQAIVVAAVTQSQAPENCHFYAACTVFVAPSKVSLMVAETAHRQRFLPPETVLLTAFTPVFDTPPPRA